jgi:hypothetical protein
MNDCVLPRKTLAPDPCRESVLERAIIYLAQWRSDEPLEYDGDLPIAKAEPSAVFHRLKRLVLDVFPLAKLASPRTIGQLSRCVCGGAIGIDINRDLLNPNLQFGVVIFVVNEANGRIP